MAAPHPLTRGSRVGPGRYVCGDHRATGSVQGALASRGARGPGDPRRGRLYDGSRGNSVYTRGYLMATALAGEPIPPGAFTGVLTRNIS